MDKSWMKDITIEDMPNSDMKLVAELCGIDVAVSLLENLNGITIYVPKLGNRSMMKRYIIKHYNGSNAKKLAVTLGVSEQFIFKVLAEENHSPKNSNQLSLLEGD